MAQTIQTENLKPLKLVVSCGGTGGHFYPGLTIAENLERTSSGSALVIVGGKHAAEQLKICENRKMNAREIACRPLTRNPFKLIPFVCAAIKGFFQARKTFRTFKPDAVLCMGSYTALPVVYAARSLHIPLFLHDGNARIGKSNRFFSRYAAELYCAFAPVNAEACKCRVITTGMPVRRELLERADHPWAYTSKVPTILIFGGSLGANSINKKIPLIINGLPQHSVNIIHLTGGDVPENLYPNFNAEVRAKSDDMGELYQRADFVICRAGGSTLAELALFGKAAILIPYPFAAEDHQNDNARAHQNAAYIIQDKDVSAEKLIPILQKVVLNNPEITGLSAGALENARPHATEAILGRIRKIVKK